MIKLSKEKTGTKENPKKVAKLPDNPTKGTYYQTTVNPAKSKNKRGRNLGKREVTFKATGKTGFGKYRITENKKKRKQKK